MAKGKVSHIEVKALVADELPALLSRSNNLVRDRASVFRVDGEIVGTGRSDYTTTNTVYRCRHGNETFQLIDVPGIEGNEKDYEGVIREALAKAHVVFYVNGTNKKPETDTAEKIKRYLRHDAVVHPIMNVRGKGDTYEYPEDRCSLRDTHKDTPTNGRLTTRVLREQLGGVVRKSVAVQGMVALSALSWRDERTTMMADRVDLVRSQKGLVELFESREAMRAFSQIDDLTNVLVGYAEGGYRKEIESANHRRLVRRLKETLADLEECLEWHSSGVEVIRERAGKSVQEMRGLVSSFRRDVRSHMKSELNTIFSRLAQSVEAVIEEFFSSTSKTREKVDEQVAEHMDQLRACLEDVVQQRLDDFRCDLKDVLKRMEEDIEARLKAAGGISLGSTDVSLPKLDLHAVSFQLRDAGGFFSRILGYGVAGAFVGSPAGGVGAVPGALIGAAVGAVVTGVEYLLLGRNKKIRKAKAEALESLDVVKKAAQDAVAAAMTDVFNNLKNVVDQVAAKINQQVVTLEGAGSIISQQREHVLGMYQPGKGNE